MNGLIIFNTVINILIIVFACGYYGWAYFTMELDKTFWLKKPYAIHIIKWVRNRHKYVANSGTVIFRFQFRPKPKDSLELKRELETKMRIT